ncbi:MAG: hypothetical protein P1P90_04530 [Patescibacteria group bacterium]|nr:hypothetical protein [Patescibacteria group bacterium]
MRYLISTLIVLAVTITIFAQGANAKTIDSGELIKASSPAVYYYFDGKRYVFPNEDVYFSWYDNFDDVNIVSDATLASVPLGGNVTYRPGTKLVKIVSDPKVYMIAENNVLSWITSEADAVTLYGTDWSGEVRDVSDALFLDYKMGDAMTDLSNINEDWKSLIKYSYPFYASVQKAIIAEMSIGDIDDFLHPSGMVLIDTDEYGYSATTTAGLDELYVFFMNNSAGWTVQLDYFHGYSSGTARLLNFSKAVGDTFAHRSIVISSEDAEGSAREILFHEITFPKGYLSYPGAVTINYVKGDYDVEQALVTSASSEEVENWYNSVGATLGWNKAEPIMDTEDGFIYNRMENPGLNYSLQQVLIDGSQMPEFVGLVLIGTELNKTIK